jgi:hypothetical protein
MPGEGAARYEKPTGDTIELAVIRLPAGTSQADRIAPYQSRWSRRVQVGLRAGARLERVRDGFDVVG